MSSARSARYAAMSDPDRNDQFRRPWTAIVVPIRSDRVTGPDRCRVLAIHAGPRSHAPNWRTPRHGAKAQVSAGGRF